jgi:CDP-3, 6-dideoxy-D-glycero-L-glycero-4-hexulose-4-reductase
MKSILITGGSGYIGRALSSELVGLEYQVHWLTRGQVEAPTNIAVHVVQSKEELSRLFERNTFDLVIHLAADYRSQDSDSILNEQIEANFTLGVNLLSAMTNSGCLRFINTTTYWEDFAVDKPFPNCMYSALKKAFRLMIDYFCANFDLKCISLRLFDVYGPRDTRKKIFKIVADAAKAQEPLKLTKGTQTVYWTHIDDVCDAYVQAIELLESQQESEQLTYDVRGTSSTLKEAVEQYVEVKKYKKLELQWGALEFSSKQIMNPVIKNLLPNWKASVDFRSSLKEL